MNHFREVANKPIDGDCLFSIFEYFPNDFPVFILFRLDKLCFSIRNNLFTKDFMMIHQIVLE